MSFGLRGLGLDKELSMIMNANRPNPSGLQGKIVQQQKAGITPQLLDVLASQKLLKEKQDAKTAMMADAAPSAGTIAEQQDAMLKQQAVADLQREVDVAKQVGMGNAIMNARNKRRQQAALKQLTGARKPRGIAGAPVPRPMKAAQGGIVGFQSGALVPYVGGGGGRGMVPYGFNFSNQLIPSSNIVGPNPYAPRKDVFVPLQVDPTFTPKTDISPRTFPTIPAMTDTKPVVPTFIPKGGPGTFPVPKNIKKKETVEDTPETTIPQGIKSLQFQPKDNLAAVLRAFQGGNPAAVQSLLAERDRQTKLAVDQFNIESDLKLQRLQNDKLATQIKQQLNESIARGDNRNALFNQLNKTQQLIQNATEGFNSFAGMSLKVKLDQYAEDYSKSPSERKLKRFQAAQEAYDQALSRALGDLPETADAIREAIARLDFDTSRPATQI